MAATDLANKTVDEIVADLRTLLLSIEGRGTITRYGTISIPIPEEQWYALMWLGCWPDLPPALDLWRLGVATDLDDAHARHDAAGREEPAPVR
jgi:hypothetical protein